MHARLFGGLLSAPLGFHQCSVQVVEPVPPPKPLTSGWAAILKGKSEAAAAEAAANSKADQGDKTGSEAKPSSAKVDEKLPKQQAAGGGKGTAKQAPAAAQEGADKPEESKEGASSQAGAAAVAASGDSAAAGEGGSSSSSGKPKEVCMLLLLPRLAFTCSCCCGGGVGVARRAECSRLSCGAGCCDNQAMLLKAQCSNVHTACVYNGCALLRCCCCSCCCRWLLHCQASLHGKW